MARTQWQEQMITEVKRHALANYERDGWDRVVESWDDGDIAFATAGRRSIKTAIAAIACHIRPLAEHCSEIVATAF
jgi:hypothetical protein